MNHMDYFHRRTFLKSAGVSIGTAHILSGAQKTGAGGSLVQRLGYPADARVVIVTADEFGECHASNMGVIACWEAGLLKSCTFQAPGCWAPEAVEYARKHPDMDVGVHLTLTTGTVSGMGIRPILPRGEVPGLCTPNGYLWPTGIEAWQHTNLDEIRKESRAQIEQALHVGIDPTHIDPHDGIMQDRGGKHLGDFVKVYAEIAKEFNLPVRMPPTQAKFSEYGLPDVRPSYTKMGILMPDEGLASIGQKSFLQKFLHDRLPGTVSEIYIHPAVDGAEVQAVRATGGWWKVGTGDYQLFATNRDEVRQMIKDEGIVLIGWRAIRDLQRHGG
jgi:predicted glycoside hydrolase/deacetylase ChbG (UPF0249 family)